MKICPYCYDHCEIHSDGSVYPCCPTWCKNYSFGNLLQQSFEEIYNGEKAVAFRKAHREGKADDVCQRNLCSVSFKEAEDIENYSRSSNGNILPQRIKMCWDWGCNVACITCRDQICMSGPEDYKRMQTISDRLEPVLPYVREFSISGSGDPFGSPYSRDLIRHIAEKYENVRFALHTNGVLCSEEMVDRLGIRDRINFILVSIHAATRETYDRIVKFGNFDRVMNNLKWISAEVQKKKIGYCTLIFVVHKLNYKEMPQFAQMARALGFSVSFTACQDWGHASYTKDYKSITVWDEDHPEFEAYKEVLKAPILQDPHVHIQGALKPKIKEEG